MTGIVYVKRKEHFSAGHRLYSHRLSADENKRIYGKCCNFHGHNYDLEVVVAGNLDPTTGMFMNITDLKKIIDEKVLKLLDHKNLDEDVSFFKENPSTTENVAVFIWNQLKEDLGEKLHEIVIHETERNSVIYRGGQPLF